MGRAEQGAQPLNYGRNCTMSQHELPDIQWFLDYVAEPSSEQPTTPPDRGNTENGLRSILTVDELAAFLRINRKTLYESMARGEIPGAQRVGRTIRIVRDSVLAWLKSQGRVAPGKK